MTDSNTELILKLQARLYCGCCNKCKLTARVVNLATAAFPAKWA